MRICRNSTAWILLQTSVVFGQLPYHALKLLGTRYVITQDAFQKLCRSGYLEVIKAPGHKSFFVTDAGFETYCRICQKDRRNHIVEKPTGSRNIEKAVRLSRINEARMFFVLLCGCPYHTSLEIKRRMEKTAVRSADSLKYSRFVGCIYDEERFTHPVYHFGNGNQRLNPNGEKNAAVRLAGSMMSFDKVILVETPEAIVDILAYSLWTLEKDLRALRHMRLNFHITWEDNAILLPLITDAGYFAQAFCRKDWQQTVQALEDETRPEDGIFLSTLDGRWMDVLIFLSESHEIDLNVTFAVWDFQIPIFQELDARGLLHGNWSCSYYHIEDFCSGMPSK